MIRAALLLVVAAGPAGAQALFSPPAGCEAFVTVQSADCTVEHLMRCEGGDGVTMVTIYAEGGDFVSVTDAEGQWIYSYDGVSGRTETLQEPQPDPSLLTDLFETGRNVYDFSQVADDGTITRFVGKENLTGEEAVIDGVTLLRTQNQMEAFASDGTWLWSVVSQEYVHPEWRVFTGGTSMWNTPQDGEYPGDSTPVEFIFPGEPGFLTTAAAYGCAG